MKKMLVVIIVTIVAVGILPLKIFAHVVVQDGPVEATVHIDPGDNPIVGEMAHMHFMFTTSKQPVDLTQCNCHITITEHGNTLFDKTTPDPELFISDSGVLFMYTFPETGIYKITLDGTVGTTSFNLPFDLRVDRDQENPATLTSSNSISHYVLHHLIHIIIFGGGFVVGGVLIWHNRKKRTTI